MIYIIDGTGPLFDSEYHTVMEYGFCKRMEAFYGAEKAKYLRGPRTDGLDTYSIARTMLEKINFFQKEPRSGPIILIGHSRGGAGVIWIAHELAKLNTPVYAMVLFDAVRRADPSREFSWNDTLIPGAPIKLGLIAVDTLRDHECAHDKIPSNVANTIHFVRDPKFANFFLNCDEYKNLQRKLGPSIGLPDRNRAQATQRLKEEIANKNRLEKLLELHKRMQDACRFNCLLPIPYVGFKTGFSFGNTGLKAEPPREQSFFKFSSDQPVVNGLSPLEYFEGTHGALGGAPLDVSTYIDEDFYREKIRDQERVTDRAVWSRAQSYLSSLGIHPALTPDRARRLGMVQ